MNRRHFLSTLAAVGSSAWADDYTPITIGNVKDADVSTGYNVDEFRLHMYSWQAGCIHCERWKNNEEQSIICDVRHVLTTGTAPVFRLQLFYRGKWVPIARGSSTANGVDKSKSIQWTGYTSAVQINSEIIRQIQVRNNPRGTVIRERATQPAPPPFPRRHPRKRDGPEWAYSGGGGSALVNHLASVHGVPRDRVRGLTNRELVIIHSNRHNGYPAFGMLKRLMEGLC